MSLLPPILLYGRSDAFFPVHSPFSFFLSVKFSLLFFGVDFFLSTAPNFWINLCSSVLLPRVLQARFPFWASMSFVLSILFFRMVSWGLPFVAFPVPVVVLTLWEWSLDSYFGSLFVQSTYFRQLPLGCGPFLFLWWHLAFVHFPCFGFHWPV